MKFPFNDKKRKRKEIRYSYACLYTQTTLGRTPRRSVTRRGQLTLHSSSEFLENLSRAGATFSRKENTSMSQQALKTSISSYTQHLHLTVVVLLVPKELRERTQAPHVSESHFQGWGVAEKVLPSSHVSLDHIIPLKLDALMSIYKCLQPSTLTSSVIR